jgi:hypothetical protein
MASFQGLFTRSRGPRPPPFINDVSLTHREDARPEARADPYYPPASTFILPNTSAAPTAMILQEVYRNDERSVRRGSHSAAVSGADTICPFTAAGFVIREIRSRKAEMKSEGEVWTA